MVLHSQTCPFTPHLARLGDLIKGFDERVVDEFEISRGFSPRMLQLDQGGPQTACGKVNFERFVHEVFGLLEFTLSKLQHDSFEAQLPLSLDQVLGLGHDLSCTVDLINHLEMLGILKQRHRHLFLRNLLAAALNSFSCLSDFTHTQLNSACDQPDFPLKVVWAGLHRYLQVF